MSRRAHPREAVILAKKLRADGMSYTLIARAIYTHLGISVSWSSVRDWTTYRSRCA